MRARGWSVSGRTVRALCARRGWTVVGEYVDNDISAYSGRLRPAYQRLCEDIRAGHLQLVVAWAPERLHRYPRELEDFLELIEATGTGIETVKAGVWDVSTSHGRLVARMLGAVSRAESERLGERVHRAHLQARQQGLWRGAIPFGMRATAVQGRIEPDPEQAGLVEEIIAKVTRGDSLHSIARDLRPRRGQLWQYTGVERLLASSALGGLIRVDGELRPGAFDGVITAEEWHAGQAALRRRPRGERRRPPEKLAPLGGILRCAEHRSPATAAARTTPPSTSPPPRQVLRQHRARRRRRADRVAHLPPARAAGRRGPPARPA